VETVSAACVSTGAILSAYALGGFPLILAGTDEQKQRYLPDIVRGKGVSFALTERGAGSDASALKTTAEPEGRRWRIRGEKIYIGNGGAAGHYLVFANAERDGRAGITAFMVSSAAKGVIVDRYEDKMGIRGTRTSNLKLDTVVEEGDILGEFGRGLRLALQTLNVGRVTVAAQSVGLGLAALEAAAGEASRRTTFGKALIDHQGIGFQLADVATQLTAARLMTYQTARAYDECRDISVLGAMTKLFASEAAHLAADVAVQVYGGEGYCKPCIAERLYRDQRVLQIYEGGSEIQRLVIARALKSATPSC
jgi:alkylation response protein AidB-like acyl-CoA dehydrogenase